jgi:hypothetical protein
LAFYCTRAARKILARPDAYLNKIGVTSFWFLLASLLIGFLGVVALSISLLIVKTATTGDCDYRSIQNRASL